MAENGAATEVVATVENSDKNPLADLQAAFDKLSPEEKTRIMEMGVERLSKVGPEGLAALQQQVVSVLGPAVMPTAGRPAVAAPQAPVASPPPAAPVQAPSPPVQAVPDMPSKDSPPGFSTIPEAVYLWTAQGSENMPIWGLLGQGRKAANGSPGRLVFKLMKPAYAFTRSGKRVLVPAGGRVMITLVDALEPLLQLADAKDEKGNDLGCAVVWLRVVGEPIPTDGGGKVYPYDLKWEHMPDEPGRPRWYPRELFAKAG